MGIQPVDKIKRKKASGAYLSGDRMQQASQKGAKAKSKALVKGVRKELSKELETMDEFVSMTPEEKSKTIEMTERQYLRGLAQKNALLPKNADAATLQIIGQGIVNNAVSSAKYMAQ